MRLSELTDPRTTTLPVQGGRHRFVPPLLERRWTVTAYVPGDRLRVDGRPATVVAPPARIRLVAPTILETDKFEWWLAGAVSCHAEAECPDPRCASGFPPFDIGSVAERCAALFEADEAADAMTVLRSCSFIERIQVRETDGVAVDGVSLSSACFIHERPSVRIPRLDGDPRPSLLAVLDFGVGGSGYR